jgi:hypothetical protein
MQNPFTRNFILNIPFSGNTSLHFKPARMAMSMMKPWCIQVMKGYRLTHEDGSVESGLRTLLWINHNPFAIHSRRKSLINRPVIAIPTWMGGEGQPLKKRPQQKFLRIARLKFR